MAKFSYITSAGRTVTFPTYDAYEAAGDWFNDQSLSKGELISETAKIDPDGLIWGDADCTSLAPDWADIAMCLKAKGQVI